MTYLDDPCDDVSAYQVLHKWVEKKNVSDCFQTKTNCTFSFTFGKNYGSIVISNEGKSYESYSNPYAPPC